MNRIVAIASAAGLSLALLAGAPAFAQVETAEEVMTGLETLGVETEGMVLTEDQVLQIELILNGTDSDEDKKAAIDALLAE